jgi:transcription elongation GreA/GreB family factor
LNLANTVNILSKEKIHQQCLLLLQERLEAAFSAMEEAQESTNGEDKSSAGDKFETSRAMGHIDRNMYAMQAAKAKEEYARLLKMNPKITLNEVMSGALVITNTATIYFAVGIGNIKVDEQVVMVVSPAAPIAQAMMGKKAGDTFSINGKMFEIKTIE